MYAVINRSFTPDHEVPGEALLGLANSLAALSKTHVLTQSNKKLASHRMHENLSITYASSFTDSNSSILYRIIEAVYFMMFVIIFLIRRQPKRIYIATDPPIIIPFMVAIYSKFSGAKFYYHIQDLHPESYHSIKPLNEYIYFALATIDNYSLSRAEVIITLSDDMLESICKRSEKLRKKIILLPNTCIQPNHTLRRKNKDIIFAGNAGRLQNIDFLIDEITEYLFEQGCLNFTFLGTGVFKDKIKDLSNKYPNSVQYLGFYPLQETVDIINAHKWGLLPIKEEALKYAFPSKSAAYAVCGCNVIGICGVNNSLSRWIKDENLGISIVPKKGKLKNLLKEIEIHEVEFSKTYNTYKYSNAFFIKTLNNLILAN